MLSVSDNDPFSICDFWAASTKSAEIDNERNTDESKEVNELTDSLQAQRYSGD